jgi:hypothetical protein
MRASSEHLVRTVRHFTASLGSLRRAVILGGIIAANCEHITRSAQLSWRYGQLHQTPPDSERRPVNMNSLASSLAIPWETTRRHVHSLIADRLCERVDGGVIVPTRVMSDPRAHAMIGGFLGSFHQMIAALKAIDFDFEAISRRTDLNSDLVVEPGFTRTGSNAAERILARVAMEYQIRALVGGSAAFGGDWMATAVFAAIMSANSEAFAADPQTAWRYSRADSPPPDDLRTPVTISQAALRLGVPNETVRRQVQSLVRQGRIERARGGYLASMTYMQGPVGRESAATVTRAFYRMVYDLNALGVSL